MDNDLKKIVDGYGKLLSVEIKEEFDFMRPFETGVRHVEFPNDCHATCTYENEHGEHTVLEWCAFNVPVVQIKDIADKWDDYEANESEHQQWIKNVEGRKFQLASVWYGKKPLKIFVVQEVNVIDEPFGEQMFFDDLAMTSSLEMALRILTDMRNEEDVLGIDNDTLVRISEDTLDLPDCESKEVDTMTVGDWLS